MPLAGATADSASGRQSGRKLSDRPQTATSMNIRAPTPLDQADIKLVVEDAGLFPAEMLDEMIEPFFNDDKSLGHWLICEIDRVGVIGFSYTRPEELTEGTWNLLAIGFRTEYRGRGYGAQLIARVEQSLIGARILIVETSGLDDFEVTRSFYETCGYTKEAVIRDYWADGDDKVIYRKSLKA